MADQYISPTGDDTTGAGTVGDPWQTFGKGYGEAASGDTVYCADGTYLADTEASDYFYPVTASKNITFEGSSGDRAAVIFQGKAGQSYAMRLAADTSTLTFKHMTIETTTNDAGLAIVQWSLCSLSLVLYDCVVAGHTFAIYSYADGGASARTTTITDSDISVDGASHCINITDIATVTITGSTVSAAAADAIRLETHIGEIVITDNVITTSGSTCYGIRTSEVTGAIASAVITGNTLSAGNYGMIIPEYCSILNVSNNTVTLTTHDDACGIFLGLDAATNANAHGMVVCRHNIIRYTGAIDSSHGMLIGAGVDYGEVSHNKVFCNALGSSVNIGLVVKGEGNHVHHNIVTGVRALLLKGAARCKIHHNTFVSTSNDGNSRAIEWKEDGAESSEYNTITNNIFDGSLAKYCVYMTSGTVGGEAHGNNMLDYNCYLAGTIAHGYNLADTETYTALSDLVTKWGTWTDNLWTSNDANSLITDPVFVDTVAENYDITIESVIGYPDINSHQQPMGAINSSSALTQSMIETAVQTVLETNNLDHVANATGQVDLVGALNATAVTAIQNGLATATALATVSTDVNALNDIDATAVITALKTSTGFTAGGTLTFAEVTKIIAACTAGDVQDKTGSTTTQEVLDADDGSTVVVEITPSSTTPYRSVTLS